LDRDGDYLVVFGNVDGFPKFQVVQNNRIRSANQDNLVINDGIMAGTIANDGVYYTNTGRAVAYRVENGDNMVSNTAVNSNALIISARDAQLVFDPLYMDKQRGVPTIGTAILQALSIQELDSYLMEKCKIQSSIALIEKTPTGQSPVELQNTLEQLMQAPDATTIGSISPNTHAVQVVQGSSVRYVHAEGGELMNLTNTGPQNELQSYIERLETQVLATLGVPHQLVFSVDRTGGRITNSIAEIFRGSIKRRQGIMDKTAKLRVSVALAKAQEEGIIPRNDTENLSRVIEFTHPPIFTLDARYDNDIVTDNYNNGLASMNDTTLKLHNKSAEQVLNEQEKEQIMFFNKAKKVSEETGVDVSVIISNWRQNVKMTRPPEAQKTENGNEDSVTKPAERAV
jgi:hypothetical protein